MKCLLITLFLMIQGCVVYGKPGRDDLLKELNKTIDSTAYFDALKLKSIGALKSALKNAPLSPTSRYTVASKLYEEYKLFNFDSAFIYATELENIASALQDPARVAESKLKLAFVLLSAGMFKETFDKLSEVNSQKVPDSLSAEYFTLAARYYFDLAAFNSDRYHSARYDMKGTAYLDSALQLLAPPSFEYYYYYGLRSLKLDNIDKESADFRHLLHRQGLSHHQTALVASTLSSIYRGKGDMDKAIEYQVQAAIADIKSSTKETYAIFSLAELLFKQEDFKNASRYIEKAIDDATFYGARLRKVQVSSILSIIEGEKVAYMERQRQSLLLYGAVSTFFLILLAFLLVVIYKQFQKIKKAKSMIMEAHAGLNTAHAELQRVNARLTEVNTELQEVNEKLRETNTELQRVNEKVTETNSELQELNARLTEAHKIKEEYIGYFFNINSAFFQKLERWKKAIEQKIADRKIEDIKAILHNINTSNEKEELLKSFDKVFLKLFPNFVQEFNALFSKEDGIKLKEGEFLNTDLRIYALMRMGITEHEKIAEILEYSVKTIYTYKAKVKNRTIVPKEEFEKRVMSIRSVYRINLIACLRDRRVNNNLRPPRSVRRVPLR